LRHVDFGEDINALQNKIQIALNDYVAGHYTTKEATSSVYYKDESFTIIVAGERTNLSNYWSGRFASKWVVSITSDSAFSIEGEIKVKQTVSSHGLNLILTAYVS